MILPGLMLAVQNLRGTRAPPVTAPPVTAPSGHSRPGTPGSPGFSR